MQLTPDDITIAVTVYRRLEYLEAALDSAVNQTVPVRVRLYDDGGQDSPQLTRILAGFSGRVEHIRNPRSLGLFGNMNACIQQSSTPWVSILHDDDLVEKDFVERVLDVAPEVERCSLFCGGTVYLKPDGREFHRSDLDRSRRWRRLTAEDFALKTWFAFPGQLIHAPTARQVGGFPTKSIYTGDWELWFRLAMVDGVVQLGAYTGRHRTHLGAGRGTVAAAKTGRKIACCGMQAKRNVLRLRRSGSAMTYDRRAWVRAYAPMYRDLIVYAWGMPRWLLRYNRKVLLLTEPQGRGSRALHYASRTLGTGALRLAGLARMLAERTGLRAPQTF
ncbi:hypothetical protein DB347_17070 [Opitutaceae bacterium EW11]|nr:hypothetical protein DB347_17070 [Opitutaceae bacterium EW11]